MDGLASTARPTAPGVPAVDVRAAIEQVLEMRRYEHTRAGYDVALAAGGLAGMRIARVEPNDFREMVLSLLLNAEQALAGRPGGAITARLEQDGEAVVVVIQDNGPGLPPDLADPFAAFTTTRAAAAGLGLFAARALAARNGAALELRSRPGEGTTATLRLVGAPS